MLSKPISRIARSIIIPECLKLLPKILPEICSPKLVPEAAPRAVLHNPEAGSHCYSQKYSGNKFLKIIIKIITQNSL